jgi:hypothetical protein
MVRTLTTVVLLWLGASIASAQTPSTNDANRALGWAHVNQVSIDVGSTTLEFVSTRGFYSCFEYRTDGDTSQLTGNPNPNPAIMDGLYPYTCVNNSSSPVTLAASSYVEVRMVFGAETDERFGWTKFFVLGAQVLKVKPWVYDPDDTGVASAAWVTKEGLADAGGSNHALYLSKSASTSTFAAGGATVDGALGILAELGFDYRNDGHCGAGAPRFNVYTTAGTYYFFGCHYGEHTEAATGWTRVTFTNADAFPANGVTPFPGFGFVEITGIDIVFDEGTDVGPGWVYLDNINVNGILIGKPGLAK